MTAHVHNPDSSPYNYTPTRYVALIMLSLFGISTVIHIAQAIKYRLWWLFLTVCLCGAIELAGWAGRLWSSYNVLSKAAFDIEITCTIIGPTPLLAANFVILGRIIGRLGPQYSRLKPRLYTILFTSSDIISLVVQGVGGGAASAANTSSGATTGGNIILAGIILQLGIIIAYAVLAAEFYVRYNARSAIASRNKERGDNGGELQREMLTRNIAVMCLALTLSTMLLFIRAIYRVAELADGWSGPIMSNQVLFNIFDGTMVILAMYTINFAHPGRLLAPALADSVLPLTENLS